MTDHTCLICQAPMILAKNLSSKADYRTRRFNCPVCSFSEMICSDGLVDLKYDALSARDEIQRMYDQQEENDI